MLSTLLVTSLALVSSARAINNQYETDKNVVYKTVAASDYNIADTYKPSTEEYKTSGGGGGGYGGQPQEGYKQEEKYAHQPYGFGYNIDDGYGNKQWRHEKSANPHQVTGTYGYKDKNGVMREVEYVADKNGFRAVIKTTEPGTAPKDPAYVKMNANPIQVAYYPQKQQSYGKGQQQEGYQQPQQQAYQQQEVTGYGQPQGDQYSTGNNYGGGGGGSGGGYQKNEGTTYAKAIEAYENEYSGSSQAGVAKATVAKYQDKK